MELIDLYSTLYEHFGPQNWWPGDTTFEICVGAILTQNTSWSNVEKALANLEEQGLLTVETMRDAGDPDLKEAIKTAGFYNQKLRTVRGFLDLLDESHGGDLRKALESPPSDLRAELINIKGIGPETADSIMLYAAGEPFFVVDAYTYRILDRHGFPVNGMNYEELKRFMEDALPREAELYNECHALLVKTGKEFCRKRKPLCRGCPLEDTL